MKAVIIITIILLNLFLLYTNIQRQNRINILTNQLTACEQQSVRSSKYYDQVHIPGNLVNNKNTLSLITLFSEQGYSPCVIEEIRLLNEIYFRYARLMDIYLLSDSGGYLANRGAMFHYEKLTSIPELQNIHVDNPVSFLVDRNNTIQLIHKAETGNPEKSRMFFKRVESLFESVYGH